MFRLMLLTIILSLFLVYLTLAEDGPVDKVTIVKLDSAKKVHVTTRTVWRLHAGELYLIRHDGLGWAKPVLVSEEGRDDNWYPNLIEDCSGEIGVLYLRNFYRPMRPKDIEAPWDVMFTKVERVKKAASSSRP